MDLQNAKQISRKMHNLHRMIAKTYRTRLEYLLPRNDLKRVHINSDGNCFFSAVCRSRTGHELNAKEMRSRVCEYMLNNKERFVAFFESTDEFVKEAASLKTSGR